MDKGDLKKKIIDILLQPFPRKKGLRLTEKTALWFANQVISEFKEEIEGYVMDRLPAFPPKNKAKEFLEMKLFSAKDIKTFLNKL